ncbi:MAG: alanine racemase [Bacteroidota bacterium]
MLDKPTLFINKEKTLHNVERMYGKLLGQNTNLQPHAKTHQSRHVANWLRDYSIDSLTVSSMEMLSYFAKDQWNKLLLALPIHPGILAQVKDWNSTIDLTVISSSIEHICMLDNVLDKPIKVLIDCDPEYGRTGILIHDHEAISTVIKKMNTLSNIQFSGFYLHAGHSYYCNSKQEILNFYSQLSNYIGTLKGTFNYPVYFGDTPTCSVANNFDLLDVATPGNFIFYDLMQTHIGSCTRDDISIEMVCPVIDWKHNGEQAQLIIHGGAVHFSKDSMTIQGQTIFGQLSRYPSLFVHKLSQEHGLIYGPSSLIEQVSRERVVHIQPVHSCLSAQSMGFYIDSETGLEYDHMSKKG